MFVGQKVTHRVYGRGTIESIDATELLVKFESEHQDLFCKGNSGKYYGYFSSNALSVIVKERGFAYISIVDPTFPLPTRSTSASAGYDMHLPEDVVLDPKKVTLVPLGIKAYMPKDEFLGVCIRSSIARKKTLILANGMGIIDSDYYNNEDNEGNIGVLIYNWGEEPVSLSKGDRIAQGIFYHYETTGDSPDEVRVSGFGSTGE